MFGGGLFGDLPPPSQSSSVSEAAPAPLLAPAPPSPALSAVAPAAAAAVAPVSSSASEHGAPKPSTSVTKMVPAVVAHTPPAAARKAPGILAAPPSVLRNQSASASKPKVTAVPRPAPAPAPAAALVEVRASPPPVPVQAQPALVAASASVVEEYDPSRPNDYEEYCKERKRKKVEQEMKQELVRRRQEDEEKEQERERQRELERQKELEREAHMTGEEAWKRRGMLSNAAAVTTRTSGFASEAPTPAPAPQPPRSPSPPPLPGEQQTASSTKQGNGGGVQMTAAQRMMARMGWKEGQGLGKQEQGITTPLMAKKTDKRAGVIVNASELKKQKTAAAQAVAAAPPATSNAPTRVLLLRNMVVPGEIDTELEEEVASECSRFGVVTRVLIYEIIEQDFPQAEAVRIFVQFERPEQAGKALAFLGGRFFGGRVVKASFFDEDRFAKNQLAPVHGEESVAP